MATATFHFLGQERDITQISVKYKKEYWKWNGMPASIPLGGMLKIEFDAHPDDNRFEERITTIDYDRYKMGYPMDEGEIVFYDASSDIIKRWKFADTIIKKVKTVFYAEGEKPMITYLTLSPAIQNYGHLYLKSWNISYTEPEPYKTPIVATEQKEKPIIETISWIDEKDDQKIKSAEFKETIRVFIKVTDIDLGKKLKLKLYAKSEGVFESSKFKDYEGEVVKKLGNNYAAFKIKLDENWKINNTNPETNIIDTIYGKATYENLEKDFSTDGLDIVTQKLKGIFLEKGKDEAYYYQGKFYSATQDKKGMIPYTEKPRRQFRETKEALDKIYTKPIGKKFIDDICKRSNPYFIEVTRKKGKNSTSGKTVSWSPGDNFGGLDVNGNTKREPFLSLAHELWHAWENWTFSNDETVWVKNNKENGLEKPILNKELTASIFENKIRMEHNIPKRKWYSYKEEENGTKTGIGKIF